MDCEHYDNGLCKYATAVAEVPIYPTPHNCKNCKKHDSAENPILHSLCVVTLHKQGLFNKAKHRHLVEKTHILSQATTHNKPGTCLRNILHKIGISEEKTCKCDEYAAQMDAWGTTECGARRDEIIKHLDSQSVSWLDMARVALAGYFTTRQLVDECIKQSEVIPETEQKKKITIIHLKEFSS